MIPLNINYHSAHKTYWDSISTKK